jgi:5-formaminoimidazole-4-carboxamide-1-beta-D-ribofuranosyl 5'-monophosphate synthetase
LVCLAARHDNLIIPRRNQVLERTENVWFEKIGHLSMVASEAVLEKVIEIVERPPN